MINKTLVDNWRDGMGVGYSMDVVNKNEGNPYLFHIRELVVTHAGWKQAKRLGVVRHCKILDSGKFFDYIVGKEYDTLQDWMLDIGATVDDICYGTNRVHKRRYQYEWFDGLPRKVGEEYDKPCYVPLRTLLSLLGYEAPPQAEVPVPAAPTRDLTEMVDLEMRLHGLTIDNVYVLSGGAIVKWNDFMKK